jgi:uncharacterized protein YcnI
VPIRPTRLAAGSLAAGVGVLVLGAAPASAHVFAEETEVAAGAFSQVTITVPHGCDGSPTRQLEIQIPEDVLSITPEVHPGWTIEVTSETLDTPITGSHGESITERDAVVTLTAEPGNELPDDFRDSFTLGYQAPDTPGETLFFKTIQTCVEGETAWIEEYTGEGEEPEHPSPAVLVTEGSGDHHDAEAEEADGDVEVAATPAASTEDDDSSNGLAIGGLVLGALGLATGGAALAKSRKTA